jgi:sialate O-acetylesterase
VTIRARVGWVLLAIFVSAGTSTAQEQAAAGRGRGGFPGPQPAPTGPQLLHPMFQDHGVLQRDQPIHVYGETAPSTAVTVTIGAVSVESRSDADGSWSAMLPPMDAGGPYTLTASANGETATASDILVGDVFFCSGQSNMAFAQRQADGAEEDARTATDGEIRQLSVPTNASLTPQRDFARGVEWVVGNPETVGRFSAACYYLARELKQTVDVPMGLVSAPYGGARLRNYMSEEALRAVGIENGDVDILALYRTDEEAAIRRWGERWESWWNEVRPDDGQPWESNFDDASWETAPEELGPWALWDGGTNPDGFIGQMWMRTTVTLTAEQAEKAEAVLDLGSVNQEDETWVNGTYVSASSFTNRTRYSLPPGLLRAGRNVVVTNVYCGWRDCGLRGEAESRAIRFGDETNVLLSDPWKAKEVPDGLIGPRLPWGSVHGMTLDHNGMVLPVGAYTFRGAVWYQGESDVHFGVDYYRRTLPGLMAEWREMFNNRDLPFLIVQLPGYGPVPSGPTANTWANLREAQRLAVLADDHAALAVTVDIGDEGDLHPTNKSEVGRRLAIAARSLIYGEDVAASGPAVSSATRRGADVVVSFHDVTGALTMSSGDGPSGFELCGESQASCRWADARIDGSTVVLSNGGDAMRVRYAWGGTPISRLSDGSGLPAGPFEEAIR